MAASQENKVMVNGVELCYEIKGTGPNIIVCIPGALGVGASFVNQVKYFGSLEQYKVVTYDPRGFGKSRPPQRQFTIDFHSRDAKDTKGLMDALGFKKFSVFGRSDGAMIGIYVAVMYPDAVEKLVIWGGNTFVAEEDAEIYRKHKDLTGHFLEYFESIYGKECAVDYWGQWIDTHLKIYDAGGNICKDQLSSVKCPTFIIHGNNDEVILEYHPDFIAKNIPNSKVHKFDGAGHGLASDPEYMDEFHRIVEIFLSNN